MNRKPRLPEVGAKPDAATEALRAKAMGDTCPRCGKTNAAEIHTCTPLALKLADLLEPCCLTIGDAQQAVAAAELRRLHAENEAAHAVGIRQEQMLMDYEALLRQALDALELSPCSSKYEQDCHVCNTIAALRARLSTGDNLSPTATSPAE